MKIAVIGAGPAGMYFSLLAKKHDPSHEIRIYEQNPEGATYGWGVVFSDIGLAFLEEADPEFFAEFTAHHEKCDYMEVVHRGTHVQIHVCAEVFRHELGSNELLTNRSLWRCALFAIPGSGLQKKGCSWGSGLTHGAFYAHFRSREAMLAEAAGRACAESAAAAADAVASVPPGMALTSMLAAYLSKEHVENAERGCPLAALGSETSRQAPEVRRVATRHIKEMIDLIARQLPDWGQPGAHQRALVTVSSIVGALLLARLVDDPGLSDALREAVRKHLTPTAH